MTQRRAGILLHPSSLDSAYGIGDIGPAAHRWVEWLASTGCGLWQVLPLGPTGYGDSPYQCFSSFAGNPYLISPDLLIEDGLIAQSEVDEVPVPEVDFGTLIPQRSQLLDLAAGRFEESPEYARFVAEHRAWLDDFALFMAIKETQDLRSWTEWPEELRDRQPRALEATHDRLQERVRAHKVRQFLFFRQWGVLAARASTLGLQIIGDLPIFVAHDSSDVWTSRELFTVDEAGRLKSMAGVPPDYFSPTGQLWGNPLYRWEVHAATDYQWWISRLRAVLSLVDIVRIDHFRAFADYWSIPAGAETAETGVWLDGPSDAFFAGIRVGLGHLPIIAEDLGDLSPAVGELRDRLGLPGMKILQFAFDGDPSNPFLPEHYPTNCVVYTGTHDNETVLGWFENASNAERHDALERVGGDGRDFGRRMIATAWHSRADLALAPLQDFLGLSNEGRMNTPGVPDGNWRWRFSPGSLTRELAEDISSLNASAGRTHPRGDA